MLIVMLQTGLKKSIHSLLKVIHMNQGDNNQLNDVSFYFNFTLTIQQPSGREVVEPVC